MDPFACEIRMQDGSLVSDGTRVFTLEELMGQSRGRTEVTGEMLSLIDVLVDGRFVEALKNLNLRFRGSSNQRLIDMPETLRQGRIVLWDEQ